MLYQVDIGNAACRPKASYRRITELDISRDIFLEDCPYCGGPGVLEEENGWCWYVICADCGSQTAAFEYRNESGREEAAGKAAAIWNMGKAIRADLGE